LGEPDVDGMLARMTAAQFQEWMAFYEIEPFGPERDAVHAALTPYYMVNMLRKKGQPEVPFDNFVVEFSGEGSSGRKAQDTDAMEKVFQAFATAHNKAQARRRGM
jgi:hypothetical protein